MSAPMLLENFAELWAMSAPEHETAQRRKQAVAPLLEAFKGRPLDAITETDARAWAAQNPGRVRYVKSLYKQAVEDGVLDRSPFRHVKARKVKRPVEVPDRWKLIEAAVAARKLDRYGESLRALVLVAAGTGLRVTELCKLEARDIVREPDLRVRVRDGKGGVHREALVLEPFGGDQVADALLSRDAGYGPVPDEARLWLRPPGAYTRLDVNLNRYDVQKLWEPLRARVGLERCRFHDIRHFHATWLLDCGCTAEDVAIQLHGHPDPRTVIEVYGHPSHELARMRLRKLTKENGHA